MCACIPCGCLVNIDPERSLGLELQIGAALWVVGVEPRSYGGGDYSRSYHITFNTFNLFEPIGIALR